MCTAAMTNNYPPMTPVPERWSCIEETIVAFPNVTFYITRHQDEYTFSLLHTTESECPNIVILRWHHMWLSSAFVTYTGFTQ